ncbi:MAG: LytR/AlgR family response regulator transcription factor [Usitatibacter sp.]
MTRALIAEDEALLREELRAMLARAWPELEVVALASDGPSAIDAFETHRPEVVFLDIKMPGMSGVDVARAVGERAHVVFVTAYERHAIEAFDSGAVDYLVKPVAPERLATTVARLKARLASPPAALGATLEKLAQALKRESREPLRWITASQGVQTRLVLVQDVVYFQSDSKYTRVVTRDGEVFIRKPIKALAEELDAAAFRQVHRSTIVNLAEIRGLVRDDAGHGIIHLKSRPETLAVSDTYLPLFKHM